MELNFPNVKHKLRRRGEIVEIFDPVRKKYVVLTPEEEVRQCIIQWLQHTLNVPLSLMAVEKKIVYNGLTKRPDILVFGTNGLPLLLVECKAPEIKLGSEVLFQASAYHKVLPARFVLFTNGIDFQMFKYNQDSSSLCAINFIPNFQEMAVAVG